ncbi:MAG: dTDP-4-dehydrorhamnose 3,5-epimerase [Deltaproteobacteria bacterium]|nr:dTDP-4-dehydrorhamnose 3,5-epimerase [Deltaproteobacteria bacterium]
MKFTQSPILPDVILIDPDIHTDPRGRFLETYRAAIYADNGIPETFVQDNLSYSAQGVLRGLHYQCTQAQGKLVWVVSGQVFDVAVDIRVGSPTFGRWVGIMLSSKKHNQIYVPEGFAHGFCVVSNTATVAYKCTRYYAPQHDRGIRWNDPALGIDWPVSNPILSEKDQSHHCLESIPASELPTYTVI